MRLQNPTASQSTLSTACATAQPSQFLIVGHGCFSPDIATKISQAVASWEMPNVALHMLTELSSHDVQILSAIDYVFFLQSCDHRSCRPQIVPVCLEAVGHYSQPVSSSGWVSSGLASAAELLPSDDKPLAQKTVLNNAVLGHDGSSHDALNGATHLSRFTPGQLLEQARALYGWHPQAWSLSIPTVLDTAMDKAESVPSPRIAQALDAIAVFLRCYAAPL